MTDHEDYPFPIHDLLPDEATEEDAAAYEQTLERLLTRWIAEQGGSVHGHSGVLLSVSVDRQGREPPSAALPITRQRGIRCLLAGVVDQGVADPPIAAGRPNFETPSSLVSLVSANWADGSIDAAEDPYWHAVERQQRAIAAWHASYPEAAAALPGWRPDVTVEQQRVELRDWEKRFPEAAKREEKPGGPSRTSWIERFDSPTVRHAAVELIDERQRHPPPQAVLVASFETAGRSCALTCGGMRSHGRVNP